MYTKIVSTGSSVDSAIATRYAQYKTFCQQHGYAGTTLTPDQCAAYIKTFAPQLEFTESLDNGLLQNIYDYSQLDRATRTRYRSFYKTLYTLLVVSPEQKRLCANTIALTSFMRVCLQQIPANPVLSAQEKLLETIFGEKPDPVISFFEKFIKSYDLSSALARAKTAQETRTVFSWLVLFAKSPQKAINEKIHSCFPVLNYQETCQLLRSMEKVLEQHTKNGLSLPSKEAVQLFNELAETLSAIHGQAREDLLPNMNSFFTLAYLRMKEPGVYAHILKTCRDLESTLGLPAKTFVLCLLNQAVSIDDFTVNAQDICKKYAHYCRYLAALVSPSELADLEHFAVFPELTFEGPPSELKNAKQHTRYLLSLYRLDKQLLRLLSVELKYALFHTLSEKKISASIKEIKEKPESFFQKFMRALMEERLSIFDLPEYLAAYAEHLQAADFPPLIKDPFYLFFPNNLNRIKTLVDRYGFSPAYVNQAETTFAMYLDPPTIAVRIQHGLLDSTRALQDICHYFYNAWHTAYMVTVEQQYPLLVPLTEKIGTPTWTPSFADLSASYGLTLSSETMHAELAAQGLGVDTAGHIYPKIDPFATVYRGTKETDDANAQYFTRALSIAMQYAYRGGESAKGSGIYGIYFIDEFLLRYLKKDRYLVDTNVGLAQYVADDAPLPEWAKKTVFPYQEDLHTVEHLQAIGLLQERELLAKARILSRYLQAIQTNDPAVFVAHIAAMLSDLSVFQIREPISFIDGSPELAETTLKQLTERTTRFQRLHKLSAPISIVCRELNLIKESLTTFENIFNNVSGLVRDIEAFLQAHPNREPEKTAELTDLETALNQFMQDKKLFPAITTMTQAARAVLQKQKNELTAVATIATCPWNKPYYDFIFTEMNAGDSVHSILEKIMKNTNPTTLKQNQRKLANLETFNVWQAEQNYLAKQHS